ncbi:MAG: hypothetical protein ACJ76S_00405 [Solirubrobacteraceae bacterium]
MILSRREAEVLDCVLDAVVAPAAGLPLPPRTDAVAAFDRMLARLPTRNRVALRGLLWALELGPLLERHPRRLSGLPAGRRAAYLQRLEAGRARRALQALFALVKLAYYGDGGVMAALGYDPEPVVARGRALRAAERRW